MQLYWKNTKQVKVPVDQDVVGLQVPVDDVVLVEVLQGQHDLSQVELQNKYHVLRAWSGFTSSHF